ncbi:MAG: hypothetical protein ACFFCD_06305 [Promethearchaeota archaeon]
MLKRNRGVVSRYLFFGFLGLVLLLFATAPVASQETTTPPSFRYYLYFNDQLVAGTGVAPTEFRLDITDEGNLEPLNIRIVAGTGPQRVYVQDFYATVELVQGMGSIYRYPAESNYKIDQTFPANAPDTVIFDQTIDVVAEAEAAGYNVPEPIYTGFLEITVYITYAVGGAPSSAGTQVLKMSAMQAVQEEVAEMSVDVNVQDWYVIDPETGERRDTTAGERLRDQLSTPAGQATVGVTAVAGIGLLAAGLQAGGIFPSFMSGVPSAAALGPGSIFGTTNSFQNFILGRLTGEARGKILYKLRRAIMNKVRRTTSCPNCAAKWSAPEVCPGCGLLVADLINEYRNTLKGGATRAISILSEGKKATVSQVATKLGTDPTKAADIMSVLTEAGLLNFGTAAAGAGATTAAGVAAGIAIPQWLNLTGIAPLNLAVMAGVAAIGLVLPLAWSRYSKKKRREKYQMTEVEEVPEELPSEDIEEMEEEFAKAPEAKVDTASEEETEEE